MPLPKLILIDAGHGLAADGRTPDNGATGNGTTERQEAVEIARELLAMLASDKGFSGVRVLGIGVEERLTLAAKVKAVNDAVKEARATRGEALLLSVHLNFAGTPDAKGVEAWVSTKDGAVELANELVRSITTATNLPKRGTFRSDKNRHGRLAILDDTEATGVLVECCFLSNPDESTLVQDSARDDAFALGLHQGLRSFLRIQEKRPMPTAFADVPEGEWFAKAVKKGLEEELFVMKEDGLFHPEKPITRATLAVVMDRLLDIVDKRIAEAFDKRKK